MPGSLRFALVSCCLAAIGATDCSRYRPQQAHDLAFVGDPDRTYHVVLDVLQSQHYRVLDQDASAHRVRVRAHTGSTERESLSAIELQLDGARVHLTASGHLVRRDGSTHRTLNTELATLDKQLQKALAASDHGSASPRPTLVSADADADAAPLPVAWSEPAYDPAVWGRGNFTCLPVQLAEREQATLTLKLSDGQNADVLLSLAHAPELCRSPAQCKLSGGCPALGMGDSDHVSRLAARLSKHEIGPLATLFAHGAPVATIDLSKHGSIAQAMTDVH